MHGLNAVCCKCCFFSCVRVLAERNVFLELDVCVNRCCGVGLKLRFVAADIGCSRRSLLSKVDLESVT